MKIYVINVPVATERRAMQEAQARRFGLDMHFINAIDAAGLDDAFCQRAANNWTRSVSKKDIACFLSHRHVWALAAKETSPVMIIEDEAIIAMDIESIVAEMGHRVTGIARTRAEAVELARKDVPDLILADIQLADNSSGIDAVNDILTELGTRPVIFITAFPERLLTGDKPEPAFLISKPYTVDQVFSSVSQAMFFSSTETLNA